MIKYKNIKFSKKRGKDYCQVEYNHTETTTDRNIQYDAVYTKKSDQPINKVLDDCRMRMEAHLMFASEFIDSTINLDENMDYDKYFANHEHQNDNRFDGVEVTKVEFVENKEGNLSGVKIFGTKTTQYTDKPNTNNIHTGVINLDKQSDNYYKLVVLLDAQVHDMIKAIDSWLERGLELQNAQQKMKIA